MKVNITTLIGLLCTTISMQTLASNSDLVAGLSHCKEISDNQKRLTCFDQLSSQDVASLSTVSIADVKEVAPKIEDTEQAEAKRIDDFAKETLKKPKEEVEGITATVSGLKKLIRGQWVIDLENGQKWQQTDSTIFKLIVGDRINLEKGSFGSVYLSKEGLNRNIRVKRLK